MTKSLTATMQRAPWPRPQGFERPVSLSEVLDRVLNKGAVIAGEVVISVAGVDLIYLALNVVLTSVGTARRSKLDAHLAAEANNNSDNAYGDKETSE